MMIATIQIEKIANPLLEKVCHEDTSDVLGEYTIPTKVKKDVQKATLHKTRGGFINAATRTARVYGTAEAMPRGSCKSRIRVTAIMPEQTPHKRIGGQSFSS